MKPQQSPGFQRQTRLPSQIGWLKHILSWKIHKVDVRSLGCPVTHVTRCISLGRGSQKLKSLSSHKFWPAYSTFLSLHFPHLPLSVTAQALANCPEKGLDIGWGIYYSIRTHICFALRAIFSVPSLGFSSVLA